MITDAKSEDSFFDRVRIVWLTNNLGPHSRPLCERIGILVKHFRVFVSAERDTSHGFSRDWGSVNVTVQRSLNLQSLPRRAFGGWELSELHIPYDTYQLLRTSEPDLIVASQLGIRTLLAATYRNRHRGVKLILSATLSRESENQRSWIRRTLRKWLIRQLDGAFVNGNSGEQYLREIGYSGPIFAVPYSIDGAPFLTDGYDPQPPVLRLLYVGKVIPRKGLVSFILSLSQYCAEHPETQIVLQIVGEGSDLGKLVGKTTPHNLSLQFTPQVPQSCLRDYYGAADVFVFPSLGDEWGVVVNEALIAGRPVLGSICSQAVTELITEGKNGWMFDPFDPESTTRAMRKAFASSADELQAMSANARKSVENLTPERVAENALVGFYEVITSKSGFPVRSEPPG